MVLAGLAEFERELIRSRCGEGITRAKQRGVRFGRPPKLTPHQRQRHVHGLRLARRSPTSRAATTWTPRRLGGWQSERPPASDIVDVHIRPRGYRIERRFGAIVRFNREVAIGAGVLPFSAGAPMRVLFLRGVCCRLRGNNPTGGFPWRSGGYPKVSECSWSSSAWSFGCCAEIRRSLEIQAAARPTDVRPRLHHGRWRDWVE